MRTDGEPPWELLLSTLGRTDDARVSYAEVLAAGVEPEVMVRERLLEYGGADGYEPSGCEHGCLPNLDFDSRNKESLVGVACPHQPSCWPGWSWIPRANVDSLRCRPNGVFGVLAARHGLSPLLAAVPPPFVGLGLFRRRGSSISVVWLRSAPRGFEALCRDLRVQLGHDALIVLTAKDPHVRFSAGEQIVVVTLRGDALGDLGLGRALDELTPGYRTRVLADPTLDLDYVRVRFATQPGERHVVEINGHDFGGFRRSDVKFMRLLLLAAARKRGASDGWIDKARLRDGDDKDRALERLREELGTYDVPGVSENERRALVRVRKGNLRLGVPPENIELDESLSRLEFVSAANVAKQGRAPRSTEKQREGLRNAAVLLRDCRRLGAPGELLIP